MSTQHLVAAPSDGRAPLLGLGPARIALGIVVLGTVVRGATHVAMDPRNPDNHLKVLSHLLRFGELPLSDAYNQAFQPPLYYLLALPFGLSHSAKAVQALSLVLSLANLLLLAQLILRGAVIRDVSARLHALALVAFLPQFVRFSGFASNDCLAFFVGTVILVAALAYDAAPSTRRVALLGLALGIGLLSKGTLLAFVPVLVGLVASVGWRQSQTPRQVWGATLLMLTIAVVVGGYKFAENLIHFGRPIVHNMDFRPAWMLKQLGTYRGASSLYDFDLAALLRHPFVGAATNTKIPVLLYATFWYAYVPVESSLRAAWDFGLPQVPRAAYVAGLLPTALMVLGVVTTAWRTARWARRLRAGGDDLVHETARQLCVAALLASFALTMIAGLRYDAWSCFQSRLMFHAFLPIAAVYAWGIEAIVQRTPALRRPLHFVLAPSYATCLFVTAFDVYVESWT